MAVVMAKIEVDDFDAWKSGTFDRDPAGREGSATAAHLYRDTESPNDVIVAVEFETTEAAYAFRERLESSGALDGVRLARRPRICEDAAALTY
jgi:hypothetical protein